MAQTTVDLQFLSKQVQTLIDEVRSSRKEGVELRALTLQVFEFTRRVERRQSELRDDLEVTIKMELGGNFANLQTSLDGSLSKIEGKIGELVKRVDAIEHRQ